MMMNLTGKKLGDIAKVCLLAIGLTITTSAMAQTPASPITPYPGGEDADLWVIAGQSNGLGCGLLKGPTEKDARIMEFMRDTKQWSVAEEPLHTDRAQIGLPGI